MIHRDHLREHAHYLADGVRLAAFERALELLVRPGDRVLDLLGCGTGVLGFLALRAGASHVDAVDAGPMLEVARSVAKANGWSDQVTFHRAHSTRLELSEPVDLVIADQLSFWGWEEGLLEAFADAQERLLRPGGHLVPTAVSLFLGAFDCPSLAAEIRAWRGRPADLDLGRLSEAAVGVAPYPVEPASATALTAPCEALGLRLGEPGPEPLVLGTEATALQDGQLTAIGGWFRAELAPGVTLTNAPGDPERIDRPFAHYPIDPPIEVRTGDRIRMELRAVVAQRVAGWSVEVLPADSTEPRRRRHSTVDAALVGVESLMREQATHHPRLGLRGQARRTVLEACDGAHTESAIAELLLARHAESFHDRDQALRFVRDVIEKDCSG